MVGVASGRLWRAITPELCSCCSCRMWCRKRLGSVVDGVRMWILRRKTQMAKHPSRRPQKIDLAQD